jgi:predicted small lipoprotein YifL
MKSTLAVLVLVVSLAGCGQAGDLYLPPKPAQDSPQQAPAPTPERVREPDQKDESQEPPKDAP